MKLKSFGLPLACLVIAFSDTALVSRPALGDQLGSAEFRSQFLQLCDLASAQIQAGGGKGPFFVDSYAVRALCVAYEMTGKQQYLDACRAWSERMLAYQTNMAPRGAYYMNYGRKPGEGEGAWYVADSSSIAMGVLATAVRCKRADKQRFLNSAKQFAALVMDNYVGSAGGIRNGLWPKFDGEWWCSPEWGMKFGGLPFHQYVQSRALPDGPKLCAAGDREMAQLASLVFSHKVELTQLPVFMMMSYAERLSPGTIYKSRHARRGR